MASGYWLVATGYQLPATGYRLPATGYRLPVAGYRLPGYWSTGLLSMVSNNSKIKRGAVWAMELTLTNRNIGINLILIHRLF